MHYKSTQHLCTHSPVTLQACVCARPVTHTRGKKGTLSSCPVAWNPHAPFLLQETLPSFGSPLTSFHHCIPRSPNSWDMTLNIPRDPRPTCLHQTHSLVISSFFKISPICHTLSHVLCAVTVPALQHVICTAPCGKG